MYDTFKNIFFNNTFWSSDNISSKSVTYSLINITPTLAWILAWHQTYNKPISDPIMTQLTEAYMCHLASMT